MIRVLLAAAAIAAAWYFLPWWGALIITIVLLALPMFAGASMFVAFFIVGWLVLSDIAKKRRQKRYAAENKRTRGY